MLPITLLQKYLAYAVPILPKLQRALAFPIVASAIDQKSDGIVIETTDIHLPHAIGEALHHAYKGDLKLRYSEESYFVEVKWNPATRLF